MAIRFSDETAQSAFMQVARSRKSTRETKMVTPFTEGYVTKESHVAALARIIELENEIATLRSANSPTRDRAEYMREYRKRKQVK